MNSKEAVRALKNTVMTILPIAVLAGSDKEMIITGAIAGVSSLADFCLDTISNDYSSRE